MESIRLIENVHAPSIRSPVLPADWLLEFASGKRTQPDAELSVKLACLGRVRSSALSSAANFLADRRNHESSERLPADAGSREERAMVRPVLSQKVQPVAPEFAASRTTLNTERPDALDKPS